MTSAIISIYILVYILRWYFKDEPKVGQNGPPLEPIQNFHDKIQKYYSELAGDEIPLDLLNELVDKITDSQYKSYHRFWNQHPKSRKRYSVLKIADLEHPYTWYEMTDFLKLKDPLNYRKFSKILLKKDDSEFSAYELRKHQFESMW
jgi:hypothetical protein